MGDTIRCLVGPVLIIAALVWMMLQGRRTKKHHELYSEGIELTRETVRLQAEANELMRELISALREAR